MSAGLAIGAKEPHPTAPARCGQCPKFVPLPPDATNLGGPKMGECFGIPPSTSFVGNGKFIAMNTRVPADRAACALAELLGKRAGNII